MRKLLERSLQCGAVAAGPGEFTQHLFWRRPLPSSAFALVDRSEAANVAFQDTNSTSSSASAFLPQLGSRVTVFSFARTRLCAVYESGPHASAGPAHQWEELVPGMLNASGPELPAWVSFYYHAE